MTQTVNEPEEKEQGFIDHLLELRDRLLRIVLIIGIIFIVLFPFAQDLYNWLSDPLASQLPEGHKFIATSVISPFLVPYKLALLVAFLIGLPFVFYQIWGFIAPALYRHEKRLILPLLTSSVALFYAGMAFAFYVVLPLMFKILPSFAPDNVQVAPDIAQYLDFVMMIFIAFGFGFEMPIATILLITTGMVTAKQLAEKRPYVIVAAFTIGMFLTPPDVLSQLLLAIPMWLLFEAGLLFSHLFKKQIKIASEEKAAREAAEYGESSPALSTTAGVSSTETLFEDDRYIMQEINEDENSAKDASDDSFGDDEEYRPMTDEEMEAELDRLDELEDDELPIVDDKKSSRK